MNNNVGVMICGHGSRSKDALREFEAFSQTLIGHLPQEHCRFGYLEFAQPIIHDGLDALRDAGCQQIYALPTMLFAAGHVKNDLPSLLNQYQQQNPEMSIYYGRELGIDLKLVQAASDRIDQALAHCPSDIPLAQTALVIVGRGASDPDANSNVAKITRLLWEGRGFGWAQTAYSGVTFPLTEPAIEQAVCLGYKRIIVFPYFLFSGILIDRIYHYTDIVAARHPSIDIVKASYLGDHPLVIQTAIERLNEIGTPANAMNCQLCKYRQQMVGFEDEVGLAQKSHHHHVEGGDHDHSHQNHQVHHHPYPHAQHPLGPISMDKVVDSANDKTPTHSGQ